MNSYRYSIISFVSCLLLLSACKKEEVMDADPNIPGTIIRCADFQAIEYGAPTDTLFVDINNSNASDANDGTDVNLPLKSIKKAIEIAEAGTIVFIKAGQYFESDLILNKSGTLELPIIISAYPNGSGFENVVIDGVNGSNESIGFLFDNGASNIVLEGLNIQNMPYVGIASNDGEGQTYENITLKNLTIKYSGNDNDPNSGYGIILYAPKNFRLINIESAYNKLDGISVWGVNDDLFAENGFIMNCHTHHNDDGVDGWDADAHGIAINQGENIAVCDCQADNNSDHGFDASDYPKAGKISTNIIFENNTSHNNQNIGFSANSDSRNIIFYRNTAYNNYWGFGCYEGVGSIRYYHNIALNNRYGFYLDDDFANYVDPGDNTIVLSNNIFYNNEFTDVYQNGDGYAITFSHNALFNENNETLVDLNGQKYKPSNINEFGTNNLNTNPSFVNSNLNALDLTLSGSSPLIDAGRVVSINEVDLQYNGAAPDIGRYER